jgi:ATP-binding cassette subfamily B protein
MLMALTEGVTAVFSLIAVSVMVAFTSWWVLPVVLLAAAPTLYAGRRTNMSMFARNVAQTEETRTVRYFSSLLTGRDHAKEVRALGIGRPVLRRWREARTAKEAADVAGQTKETRTRIKGKLGSDGITLALLLALIGLTAGDRIDLATAAVAFLATRMLTAQVAGVTGALLRAGRALPFLQEFREFTADPAEPGDEPAVRPFTSLRAENVSYTYPGAERPAVDGVSLELKAGQIVALVGFNGSGKTTLTKVLAGLYEPTEGNLVRDGAVVTDDDLASLRSSTAVVFQDFARFKLSARENITLGRGGREPQDGEAERMAALAGIDTQLAGLPQGFDTVLSTEFSNGTDLSGGQWQKVAIARAFYRDAPFVILDEPTAALDPRAEAELFDRIRELFAGRTVLLISHRFSSVRNADRIHVMDQGRVVEQGTHRELLGLDGTYAELFTTQAAAYLDDDQPAS